MKTTTFENARPGDRVWDIRKGWGTIICISTECDDYPVEVRFSHICVDTYTLGGKAFKPDLNPTLFWDEVKIGASEQLHYTRLINGVKVPDISFQPKTGEDYYFPSPDIPGMCYGSRYHPSNLTDKYRVRNGMCYPYTDEGKEVARLHAKAMLGIS
jgi:hypothetical protein